MGSQHSNPPVENFLLVIPHTLVPVKAGKRDGVSNEPISNNFQQSDPGGKKQDLSFRILSCDSFKTANNFFNFRRIIPLQQ